MSSSVNKEWILNENIESDSYISGICNFIQFMIAKSGGKSLFSCPCRKCLNGTGQRDVEFISVHLFKNGMDKSYTSWYFHGEETIANQSLNEHEKETPLDGLHEDVADNIFPTLESRLHNVGDDESIPNIPDAFSTLVRMSQVADSTLPFSDSTKLVSIPRSRISIESSANTSQSIKTLKFDDDGFPIGKGSEQASTFIGRLAICQIPIGAPTWKNVDPNTKLKVWDAIKGAYNFKDSQRDMQMRKVNEAWKKYKAKLRKLLVGNDMATWLQAMPITGVDPIEWKKFCENERSEKQIALRVRNKINKNSCPRRSTHNAGRWGYARARENFKEENDGRKPMRVELWLYTHKRKGGGYAPHDEELACKLEGLLEIMLDKGEVETLDSGPIFDTFGIDKRGRVRCVGSNISRKALLASSFAKQMLEEVEAKHDEWQKDLKAVKENNELMMSQMNELVAAMKNGNFNYGSVRPTPNHSQSSASNLQVGSLSSSFATPILCSVVSHMGTVVALGMKSPLGSVRVVHNHVMQQREAKVVIDEVKDPLYPVWGGEQDNAKMLGEVAIGSYLYWHDDFLPPILD